MLLVHAKLPPLFWLEALHTTTHLLNIRLSRSIEFHTPHYRLYGQHPSYDHLRVFACLYYPNTHATTTHKLQPHSVRCIFLGYPHEHKGYTCFDLSSRRVIISRHVVFYETYFPYVPVEQIPLSIESLASSPARSTSNCTRLGLPPPPTSYPAGTSPAVPPTAPGLPTESAIPHVLPWAPPPTLPRALMRPAPRRPLHPRKRPPLCLQPAPRFPHL
jgi:histone deacetylase 1/2